MRTQADANGEQHVGLVLKGLTSGWRVRAKTSVFTDIEITDAGAWHFVHLVRLRTRGSPVCSADASVFIVLTLRCVAACSGVEVWGRGDPCGGFSFVGFGLAECIR